MNFELLHTLQTQADTKMILFVIDGLGGLPVQPGGQTALERARTPNLDRLAAEGVCGLHVPVREGITSGSGPAHLSLLGYDPLEYRVGRGVLSALGIDFDLQAGDVAARGNFCTLDAEGKIVDRRAGRISTEINRQLIEKLKSIRLEEAELLLGPVKEYRLLFVLRGKGLSDELTDTDPQETGVVPLEAKARSEKAHKTARLVEQFLAQASELLVDEHPANGILLRGFASRPSLPQLPQIYGLRAAAIAAYPMYRGVARLVGMQVLETQSTIESEVEVLQSSWPDFDFFFLHFKPADSAGEDGDFQRKVQRIEQADRQIPRLVELKPDALLVTGDHSTPSAMRSHSWHPVPVVLWAQTCRPDEVHQFGERPCICGGLGARIPAYQLMPLMMAHASRMIKFGA